MLTTLAILASARGNGDTGTLLRAVLGIHPVSTLDLAGLTVHPYQYGEAPPVDDFYEVATAMAESDRIIFATPVYWYAMSGRLKTLFDRFTDLTTARKDIGRRLSGRCTYLVASGADAALPTGFEVPFERTSRYLDMRYGGALYGRVSASGFSETVLEQAREFGNRHFCGTK